MMSSSQPHARPKPLVHDLQPLILRASENL
jgi:hypothetical protein